MVLQITMETVEDEFNDDEDLDVTDGPSVAISSTSSSSSSGNKPSREETLEYIAKLESAIQSGNAAVASEVAALLAKMQPTVCVMTESLEDYLRFSYDLMYTFSLVICF